MKVVRFFVSKTCCHYKNESFSEQANSSISKASVFTRWLLVLLLLGVSELSAPEQQLFGVVLATSTTEQLLTLAFGDGSVVLPMDVFE